jgi:hypothetical protein
VGMVAGTQVQFQWNSFRDSIAEVVPLDEADGAWRSAVIGSLGRAVPKRDCAVTFG